MSKPDKALNLKTLIEQKLRAGQLRYSNHAEERILERKIIKPEIEFVLKYGRQNKAKDEFNLAFKNWDYCIEGNTVDGRKIRVIVAIEEPNVLVVTTIIL